MDIQEYTKLLPKKIQWCNKQWIFYDKMPQIWHGNKELLPIELIFGNYLLRSPNAMIWVHLIDEERGEPFDIWEIRIEKLTHTNPNYDEDAEETIEEDEWENVLIENQCGVKDTVEFIKHRIFEDKMAIYLKPRLPWDSKVAEQWEATHKEENENEDSE